MTIGVTPGNRHELSGNGHLPYDHIFIKRDNGSFHDQFLNRDLLFQSQDQGQSKKNRGFVLTNSQNNR